MPTQSDAELIDAYRLGKTEAFDELVSRYLHLIYRYQYRLVQNVETAQDLAQETFIKAWKQLWRFDVQRSFKTWLFTIARNTAFDYLKKAGTRLESGMENRSEDPEQDPLANIPDSRPLVTSVLEQRERMEDLESLLSTLSPAARSVVHLHDLEGMTFEEVAKAMDEPLNTVKSRYRRALASLRLAPK